MKPGSEEWFRVEAERISDEVWARASPTLMAPTVESALRRVWNAIDALAFILRRGDPDQVELDAADTLERLQRELAQAEAARVVAEESASNAQELADALVASRQDIIKQAAEIAALRLALAEALDGWEGFGKAACMGPDWPGWGRIAEIRAAGRSHD